MTLRPDALLPGARLSVVRRLALAAAVAGLLAGPAVAATAAAPLEVRDAWMRPAAAGMSMSSGYMTLRNTSARPVRLRGAATSVARSVTLHRSVVSGGVARMETLGEGLVIAPGATAVFRPGGNHMMVEGLAHPLKVGDKVPVTLSFDGQAATSVVFEVRAAAPDAAPGTSMPAGMKMR